LGYGLDAEVGAQSFARRRRGGDPGPGARSAFRPPTGLALAAAGWTVEVPPRPADDRRRRRLLHVHARGQPRPDHAALACRHDAYNKFIEDDFLGGQRLNPANDGRPDPRPDVREANPLLGNLVAGFDFNQKPRPPV
jgi:hypothetical protein